MEPLLPWVQIWQKPYESRTAHEVMTERVVVACVASAAAGALATYLWLKASGSGGQCATSTETAMDKSTHAARKGKVYLVGAGPGGVGLMTVRAFNLLKQADLLVVDELTDPAISALVSTSTINTI